MDSPRGFYTLNLLRICSITSLLATIIATSTTLIKSFSGTRFFFFEATSHLFLTTICIFLLLSETSLAPRWFRKNWPLFSPDATLTWLGIAEVAVGMGVLGGVKDDGRKDVVGRTVRVVRSVRGYRQARKRARSERSATPLLHMPTVGIQVPERSYSFRSRREDAGSSYKRDGGESEVGGSSRYSVDARSMAGWYRKELGLGEV
ncbi:hypothetical protein BDD12DRAFT_906776 [Trichophaea hybrida]|nr:hypothetical protein BDD12DRAFT_906776 [Trichophaea hybrida]